MNSKIHEWVNTVLIVLIGAYMVLVGGNQSGDQGMAPGAATPGTRWPHGVTIGMASSSPTNLADIKAGTCALLGLDVSQVATSTASYDCAVSGINSSDVIVAMPATTTQATLKFENGTGWAIISAKASTTAGYITFRVANLTGGAKVPSAPTEGQFGSTTNYIAFRSQ